VTLQNSILTFAFAAIASVMAVFTPTHAFAQSTPPRPAVSITPMPRFWVATKVADLNEDGHPDIIGSAVLNGPPPSDLLVALGQGDGTFRTPVSLGLPGAPLAIADFNGDGHQDVLIDLRTILPGRGNGSFAAARTFDISPTLPEHLPVETQPTFALVAADFNGDHKVDLLVGSSLYPGRGDFTFDPPFELTGASGFQAAVTDFNGDGRLDIAFMRMSEPFDIFLNQGSFLFSAASAPGPMTFDVRAITTADLNKDGKRDLVAVSSGESFTGFSAGAVHVFRGNGDGTFQADVSYPAGVGGQLAANTVAVGDFNHDGHADIATGGQSARFYDSPCTGRVYWDSVSILPGVGDGTLAPQLSFRLGTDNHTDIAYQLMHSGLVSGDINGDGWTDLVASPGAVLMSHAATANHAPTLTAGPDQFNVEDVPLEGTAADADNDWLTFEWRRSDGSLFSQVPYFCGAVPDTYTLTVSDGHGGSASDTMTISPVPTGGSNPPYLITAPQIGDALGTATPYPIRFAAGFLGEYGATSLRLWSSADDGRTWKAIPGCGNLPITETQSQCVWSTPGPVTNTGRIMIEALTASGVRIYSATSGQFRIVAGAGILPGLLGADSGFFSEDFGAVGAPGSASFDGRVITVKGSGADIWGTVDQFHYVATFISGDAEIIARVLSVQNVDAWTKAGVMIRSVFNASSAHASLFATPSTVKGLAFQRRTTSGGTSVSTAGPSIVAPVWLRLVRSGTEISAYYRVNETAAWTLIGTETSAQFDGTLEIGLAVSSHVRSTLATATFDHVQVRQPLPAGWSDDNVGAVGAQGTGMLSDVASVTGSGADVWGTADEFNWLHRSVSGDFSVEAQIDSVDNVNPWTKAGLMIRASNSASSQYAFVMATPTTQKGIAFQGRQANGGPATQVQQVTRGLTSTTPVYLRLTRQGNTINAFVRYDLRSGWQHMGTLMMTALPANVEVGLAVSSHLDGTLATAHFSSIVIEPYLSLSTSVIGPGSGRSFTNGTFFTAFNTGSDIWNTADDFTYLYTRWSGDGTLTARLNQVLTADQWTKAGLMFRESLAPGSRYAYALVSSSKGSGVQYRGATNGPAAVAGSVPGRSAPGEFEPGFWVRITREGNLFRGFYSLDKTTWTSLGEITVAMPDEVYVGIAVTSHNVTSEGVGQFDDVTLRHQADVPEPAR
jgi:regulation of enolase protein 1 (concanavalin A-like superfamily)